MINVPFPRVIEHSISVNIKNGEIVYPIKLSIDENMIPVSTATLVTPRDTVYGTDQRHVFHLFTANGDAGCYRIRSTSIDYASDTVTYELEHMIAEVGDWCILQKHTGNYAAATAIRRLWRGSDASATSDDSYRGNDWQLGDMSALSGYTVEMNASNRSNLLSSILDVLDGCPGVYMKFDFSEHPWTINFALMSEDNNDDLAYGKLSRNVGSAQVSFDMTDICTRVRYYYDSWHYYTADQDHQNSYGIVESKVDVSSAESAARAQYVAQEYLRKHQDPAISINISGQDLYSITGVEQDKFQIGKLFRLFVPELNKDVKRNITKLSWNDVYGDPLNVSVTLGEEDPTLWAYLKSIKKK